MKKIIAILSILALAALVAGPSMAARVSLTDANDTAIVNSDSVWGELKFDVENDAYYYKYTRNRSNSGKNSFIVSEDANDASISFNTGDADATTSDNSDINITDIDTEGIYENGGVLPENDVTGTDLDDTTVVNTNSTAVEEEYEVDNYLDEYREVDQAVNTGENAGFVGGDFDDSSFTGVTGRSSSNILEELVRRNDVKIKRRR